MKIKISTEGKRLSLALPNRLIFTRYGAKKIGLGAVSRRNMRLIRRTVKDMKKRHKGWTLVDVELNGEPMVKIKM